jgi:hypothetical protein
VRIVHILGGVEGASASDDEADRPTLPRAVRARIVHIDPAVFGGEEDGLRAAPARPVVRFRGFHILGGGEDDPAAVERPEADAPPATAGSRER